MSYETNKNFVYYISGRNIELYQLGTSTGTSDLAGYKIKNIDSVSTKTIMYPNETIKESNNTGGLMFEGTAFIDPFVTVEPNELSGGAQPNLTAPATIDESSHLNLSRMLSLAIVDYIKAMVSDSKGDLQRKEYYMKEFWKKAGDDENNKRTVPRMAATYPFGVK
jgi:hypothetical protein|tara:strand:+ start:704 stop:1198 length:495 start_codon:yes stop_codon:yes gene_type:complete